MAETNQEVLDSIAIKDILAVKNGKIKIVDALTGNSTQNVTISNVAPAEVGTATISAWLEIDVAGTKYYIPCWT
tara:strand:+ start:430 stop:651 length:222 start_codon:yes stop_codon:yes gene_type:complete